MSLSAGTFYGSARFRLGPMKCGGEAPYIAGESCYAYRKGGASQSGYYITLANNTDIPTVSFCDMDKYSGDPDFQNDLGALGSFSKSVPVYFNAIRRSSFTTANAVLVFDSATVNIGEAFH